MTATQIIRIGIYRGFARTASYAEREMLITHSAKILNTVMIIAEKNPVIAANIKQGISKLVI